MNTNTNNISYSLLAAGYCTHPECVTIKGGKWCSQKYPALCTLIKHPDHGYILFDTGYSPRFYDAAKHWPLLLYKKITPVIIPEEQTLHYQLNMQGIKPTDIAYVILSHFHADHIAGLKDFPNAQIVCSMEAFNAVKNTKGLNALKKAYLPELLPGDFESRAIFIEDKKKVSLNNNMKPFENGIDLFGDGSLIIVSLPGHATGQIGLTFTDSNNTAVFLVADSCWSSKAYREYKLPSLITYLVHDKKNEYQETLSKIHALYKNNKDIRIIPSHCQEIWQQISGA